MPDQQPTPHRRQRQLTPEEKYEIWVQVLTRELTQAQAAERWGVDVTTIMKLRKVARDGALAALDGSTAGAGPPRVCRHPSWPRPRRRSPASAMPSRSSPSRTCCCCGEKRVGLIGGVPRRVDAATKLGVLDLLDHAVEEGWDHRRACALLGVREPRARRWRRRRARERLDDLPGGGGAVHGLLDHEVTAIVALATSGDRSTPPTASSPIAAPTWALGHQRPGCAPHQE